MNLLTPIETERTVIRPFRGEDLEAYLAFMADPVATRYLMFTEEQKTRSGARELFEAIVASYGTNDPIYALAIAHKESGFIGSCGISPLVAEDGIFECYYSLIRAAWGEGYATEATSALLARAFKDPGVREIRAYMSPANTASSAVAERLGMMALGLERHPLFGNEGLAYTATREAWNPTGPASRMRA